MNQYRATVDALQGVRVLVVGDVMLDRFVHGSVERVSPEAPVPIFRPGHTVEALGGAGNVAANLKALGCEPLLICAYGRDEAAESLRRLADFEIRALAPASAITTVKERLISDGHHIARIDYEKRVEIGWSDILPAVSEAVEDADGVVFSDYGKGMISEGIVSGLVRAARARGVPIVGDPAAKKSWPYFGVDVLTPNLRELTLAWGEWPEAAHRAAAALDLKHLVVTRGAAGLSLFSRDDVTEFPTRPAEICDVVGAGDTVTAVIAASMAAGNGIDSACHLANAAAGLAVRKRGTATVTAAELRYAPTTNKFAPAGRLGAMTEQWREAGLCIGFTNGVFDLLHPGHLHLLRQAKTACDRLIVALNDDESASRVKPGRPVQDLAARIEVVAGLDCVDVVTSFQGLSPLSLVEICRPDVLVKGGDYAQHDVIGREFAGRVLVVPLLAGYSTTATVVRAQRAAA